jgi:hypothetical protein
LPAVPARPATASNVKEYYLYCAKKKPCRHLFKISYENPD